MKIRALSILLILLVFATGAFAAPQQVVNYTITYNATKALQPVVRGETQYFMVDITGNCAITIAKTVRGDICRFFLTSDASGGHVFTFGNYFTPVSTLTLTASETSVIEFIYTGSTWKETWRDGATGGGGGGTLPAASQGDTPYASATNTWSALAKSATATRYLSNTGTNNNPAWAQVALATGVSGVLPMANGGSNKALTASANSLVYSDADSFELLATGNSGVLVTSGAGVPSIATDIPTAVTMGTKYVYRAEGTDVPVTDGGTGASDAATARTNLGLGTISVLDSPLPTANGGQPATDIIELKAYRPYPDGSSNSGILADYYDSTNFKNFTRWTSASVTQDYGIAFVGTIPPNFASFGADALSVEIRSNDKDGNVHLLYMYINANTVDAGIDGASIATSANDVWETKTDTPTGSYSIGHQFKVIIKMGNDEASNTVDIGRVFLTYATR